MHFVGGFLKSSIWRLNLTHRNFEHSVCPTLPRASPELLTLSQTHPDHPPFPLWLCRIYLTSLLMILRSSAEVPSLICLEEFPDINDTSDSDSEFIPFFILFFIIIVILEIILRMCAEITRRSTPWPMTYMKGCRGSKIRTGNVILGRHRSKRRGRSCSRHLHWSRRLDRNFRPNRFLDFYGQFFCSLFLSSFF